MNSYGSYLQEHIKRLNEFNLFKKNKESGVFFVIHYERVRDDKSEAEGILLIFKYKDGKDETFYSMTKDDKVPEPHELGKVPLYIHDFTSKFYEKNNIAGFQDIGKHVDKHRISATMYVKDPDPKHPRIYSKLVDSGSFTEEETEYKDSSTYCTISSHHFKGVYTKHLGPGHGAGGLLVPGKHEILFKP